MPLLLRIYEKAWVSCTSKKEFAHFPDVEKIIAYYGELINDALNSGQLEDEFIKHLGTPGEIKHKLSHDETFKENIKTKQNFSAA